MAVDHYENFPVASRLVPARLRPAVVAIYRFARAADDLADEGVAPPAERLAALAAFDAALDAIARGETPSAAPFPELAAAVRQHRLPLAPLHDLVSAFRQDVTTPRYPTFRDVIDYCRRSANPVGRLLLALYKRESPDNFAASDAICTGLQLTNFWQDIAGDWTRGRIYVPLEDLARFGVTEAQLGEQRTDARWRALMAFETARARDLLQAGRPLVRALPARLGLELSAVIAGGMRILARIDAVDGDVFRRRPMLGPRDWVAVGFRALVPARPTSASVGA
ncbi:MAG TPA: squalene synthase HpnC [Casimicrobiaceae bacterium]|nr:squalene synthase HpnC [Casimicrobiaceae bacterium]